MAWSEEQKELLHSNAGKVDLSELSKIIGKTSNAIAQFASRNGLSISFYGHGPEMIVSEEAVKEIKRMLGEGIYTNRYIAKVTGVKESYVANIKSKRCRCARKKTNAKPNNALINSVFK